VYIKDEYQSLQHIPELKEFKQEMNGIIRRGLMEMENLQKNID